MYSQDCTIFITSDSNHSDISALTLHDLHHLICRNLSCCLKVHCWQNLLDEKAVIASWAFGWQLLSKECWALLRLHTYNLSILNAVFQLPCLKFQIAPLFLNISQNIKKTKSLYSFEHCQVISLSEMKKKGYFDRLTLFFSSSCVCNCLTSAPNKPFDALLDSVN